MAVIQYGTSTVPTAALNLFYSKLGILDEYIIMTTGEYEYSCLAKDFVTDETVCYVVSRYNNIGSGTYYEIQEVTSDWSYSVANEYYVYSNIGIGTMQVLPIHTMIMSWAITGIVCICALAIVFKGALYPCLRRVKR